MPSFFSGSLYLVLFLLPGFFFFRGVNSYSHSYISQSLLSWRTPNILAITFTVAIAINCVLVLFISLMFPLLGFEPLMLNNGLWFNDIRTLTVLIITYTFTSGLIGNSLGKALASLSLKENIPILQVVKHEWMLILLKQMKDTKVLKNPVEAVVLTDVSHNLGGNTLYKGKLSDFFLSADGSLEYLVLNDVECCSANLVDDKRVWVPVGLKTNLLYIDGFKVMNVTFKPAMLPMEEGKNEQDSKGEISFKKFLNYYSISKELLKVALFLWLTLIFFMKIFQKTEQVPEKPIKLDTNESVVGSSNKPTIKNLSLSFTERVIKIDPKVIRDNKDKEFLKNLTMKTNGTFINVRTSPSKFAKIITNLHDKGTEIKTLKEIPEYDKWYEVELSDGTIGYIFADLLSEKSP